MTYTVRECEGCLDPCCFDRVKCRVPGCGRRIGQCCRDVAIRSVFNGTGEPRYAEYVLLARCMDHGIKEVPRGLIPATEENIKIHNPDW
jgi:hypothetical protein